MERERQGEEKRGRQYGESVEERRGTRAKSIVGAGSGEVEEKGWRRRRRRKKERERDWDK